MPNSLTSAVGYSVERVTVNLTANAGAGVIASWENTTGGPVWVFAPSLRITAASTGAATADMGFATTAVTADNLLDGVTLNGVTAGTVARTPGTNGGWAGYVAAGGFVTVFGSAATTGLTGTAQFLISQTS